MKHGSRVTHGQLPAESLPRPATITPIRPGVVISGRLPAATRFEAPGAPRLLRGHHAEPAEPPAGGLRGLIGRWRPRRRPRSSPAEIAAYLHVYETLVGSITAPQAAQGLEGLRVERFDSSVSPGNSYGDAVSALAMPWLKDLVAAGDALSETEPPAEATEAFDDLVDLHHRTLAAVWSVVDATRNRQYDDLQRYLAVITRQLPISHRAVLQRHERLRRRAADA